MTRARDLADSADKDIAGTITLDAVNASGVITGLTVEATGTTAAGDNAALGYTTAEGLILTGQGSTNDVTIKNDANADVIEIPTGTVNVTMAGTLGVAGLVSPAAGITVVGSTTVDDILLTAVALPGTGNPSIALRNSDNVVYHQSGSADQIVFLDSGQDTMALFHDDAIQFNIDNSVAFEIDGNRDVKLYTGTDLFTTTAGSDNLKIGARAGDSILNTGNENVLVGTDAGTTLSTADGNTAVGFSALKFEVTRGMNTAIGWSALKNLAANAQGNNTAVGADAGRNMQAGINNTLVGFESGHDIRHGSENICIGGQAGDAIVDTDHNTLVGYNAGGATTGSLNAFYGRSSGSAMLAGTKNSIIGSYNGNQGGLDIRTSTNHIVLSDGDGNPRFFIKSNGLPYLPASYSTTTSSSANMYIQSDGAFYRSTSSRRYKNTIEDATYGLTELLTLRPVTYKGNNDGDTVFGGLIAEEVHDAGLTEFVQYNDDGEPDAIAYGQMVSLCIKAIKEQQATITALTARITALEGA